MLDLIIKNANIIDGTGAPSYVGSVGVRGGRIVISPTDDAERVIDARGRHLAPGFIDAHSHGDLILGSPAAHLFKSNQGVTTEICGQCGLSMAPVDPLLISDLHSLLSLGTSEFPEEMHRWTDFEKYLLYAESVPKTANARFMVGHNTLRMAVMGMDDRPATATELDRMKGLLRESMEAGAAGLSTGLIYTPGCYGDTEEVTELARVIAPFGGIYASHIRNEAENVVESVAEVIEVGRRSGAAVNISHHKVMGKRNHGKQRETLKMISRANEEGLRVFCDQYPYSRCMTTLNACMPPWYLSRGYEWLTESLKDKDFRDRLRREMDDPDTPYDNFYLNAGGWDGVYVYFASATPEAEGLYISEYAERLSTDPFTAFFDLCVKNRCKAGGVYSSMRDEDVFDIIRSPYSVVGSDGLTRNLAEKGHPRTMASFPHAIRKFVKEKGILTLEEMIRKMTGLTAEFLGIRGKGFIKEGFDADLVLFDFDRLRDRATYKDSNLTCEGINLVLVDGEVVYENGALTGKFPGRVLRHGR